MLKSQNYNRRSGSALILTILLITAISTVIFSTARLSISDTAQVGRLEESITAQYAAESGLELGLLSYRLNRNSETSLDAISTTSDSFNFDLTNNSATISPNPSVISVSNPSVITRMWWKEKRLGEIGGDFLPIVDKSPKLYKDQSQELDITNLLDKEIKFYWTSSPNGVYCENSVCTNTNIVLLGVEFVLSAVDENGGVVECAKQQPQIDITNAKISNLATEIFPLSWQCVDPITQQPINNIKQYKIRFKPYIQIPEGSNEHPYIYYALSGNDDIPVDNGTSNIYSIGYYGSTKRALEINIDRLSTSLSGAYDLILGALGGSVSGN